MKKYVKNILIFLFLFTSIIGVSEFIAPSRVYAEDKDGVCVRLSWRDPDCEGPVGEALKAAGVKPPSVSGFFLDALLLIPGWISIVILQLSQLLVYLSGTLLNEIVTYTIVNMATNLSQSAINTAWTTVRDVANMGFIFILLYASIQLILGVGKNTKQLIINMVVVALLINFSLFFTKIVIDMSNMLAVTVYEAAAPGSLAAAKAGTLKAGISNTLMEPLKLQTLAKDISAFNGSTLVIIGVMGTIFSLIAAFTFFAISVMFVIRFVTLTFVLILSPIAFVSFILPQLGKYRQQWTNTLIGQSFFAPIYFLLTWIVIVLSNSIFKDNGGLAQALLGSVEVAADGSTKIIAKGGDVQVIMNFLIVIAFLIITLVVAKDWANKAPPIVGKATNWLTGKASGAAFGTAAWAGRNTVGNVGLAASNNARLQELAKDGKGLSGAGARLALYASRKARSGTFDARNATIPTAAIGDLIGGTVGRTERGKKLGLNDVNISSIQVGAIAAGQTGLGTGGTKGKKELLEEKDKRIAQRDAQNANELALAVAKRDVLAGATSTDPVKIEAMEKALSKLNDKQTEALVAGNRDLLDSQEFANALSVQQLDALNKSEQLSENEKNVLKSNRFKKINAGLEAFSVPAAMRTAAHTTAIAEFPGAVKALSDKELEMIDVEDIKRSEFISEMRGPQFEAINKSNKFTTSQKKSIKDTRKDSILAAFHMGHTTPAGAPAYAPTPANISAAKGKISKMGGKDLMELMRENVDYIDPSTGARVTESLLTHPEVMSALKPNMLKKMVAEGLSDSDITKLRTALEGFLPPTHPTYVWLMDANKGMSEFI
jgi:hypothetical protein